MSNKSNDYQSGLVWMYCGFLAACLLIGTLRGCH
jgi:hypothetical protein